jgi:N-acetylglucosaminyldiphosphoundecaprenol N-acetyl-beta-D-mannosaminyltransferase
VTPTQPTAQPSAIPAVELAGVRFHALTESQVVAHVLDELDAGRGGFVVTPNLDHLRRCARERDYAGLVRRADLAVADGVPVVWASRIAGTPLPGVVTGSNLISSLSAGAGPRGRSVFLLGGAPGTAEGAARFLTERGAGLRVAGTSCPPPGFEESREEMTRLEKAVTAAAPDIVYVGLGSPKQERLIERLRATAPRAWWIGVGVSFSYLTGDVPRAPVWMRKVGLEWAYRVFREPRRLARRYLVEGIPFGIRLMCWAFAQRVRGRGAASTVAASGEPASPRAAR